MEINKIENANARMQPILPRYSKFVGSAGNSTSEHKLELKQEPWEADVLKEGILKLKLNQLKLVSKDLNGMGFNELQQLERNMIEGLKSVKARKLKNEADVSKEEIIKLKLKQLQLLVKDLSGMGLYELEQVEQELNKGLLSVWAWKDKLRMEQMKQSKVKVLEPRGSRLATARPAPICFGYCPGQKKETPANNISESPDVVGDGDAEYGYYSDKALYLWHYSFLVLILSVWFFVVCLVVVLLSTS